MGVLEGLEGDVTKTLQSIQKGIALLDQRRVAMLSEPEAAPDEGADDDGDWDETAEDARAPIRS